VTRGQYDVVLVLEMPNGDAMTKLAVALISRGNVRTTTVRAHSMEEFGKLAAEVALRLGFADLHQTLGDLLERSMGCRPNMSRTTRGGPIKTSRPAACKMQKARRKGSGGQTSQYEFRAHLYTQQETNVNSASCIKAPPGDSAWRHPREDPGNGAWAWQRDRCGHFGRFKIAFTPLSPVSDDGA
jgi:hypothetical protein